MLLIFLLEAQIIIVYTLLPHFSAQLHRRDGQRESSLRPLPRQQAHVFSRAHRGRHQPEAGLRALQRRSDGSDVPA